MDFWATDDSSSWQEEPWSQKLHKTLFTYHEKQTMKKVKKADLETQSIKVKRRQHTEEDRDDEQEGVSKKKKKKGNVRFGPENGDDDGGVQNLGGTERTEQLQPNKSKTALKHTKPVKQKSDIPSTEVNKIDNASPHSEEVKAKKRKRKPRNNKFKDQTLSTEAMKSTASVDTVESQNTEVIGSCLESSDPKLSGKERRKLRRKLAKQQLRAAKQEQAKITKKKISDDSKKNKVKKSMEQPCEEDSEPKGKDEDDVPVIRSNGDVSSNLILANTRRKTQMKPDVSLKSQMESQLKSSQFRFLNEQLYKVTGDKAKEMFASDSTAFLTYHEGFTQQVTQWPSNPVDIIIDALKKRPASLVIGDFGCGDAKIARSVKQKVHSFDLYPINQHVTVCDTKKVPLKDCVLDIAVFCLSLMGTNWMDYVNEANRVLKTGGLLKVAEVASRFTSPASFLSVMKSLGFQLKTKDVSNKMFYLFDFKKKQVVTSIPAVKGPILKPCLYKKR
ncbi:uncharacterized protein LOC129261013 [Lytechinus pictus]|uniref:uncharacterized protein LOC129261013 n=1 Tax=Lytechinus pictus TaxID=7653 RepID=UPI0030B9C659